MLWIDANGASLRYELSGSGLQTLVLVHESGGCLDSFDEVVPDLSCEFRVLRYDQRGFGFSEKVRELTLNGVAADLAGLLDALNITAPVHLAGCAMGSDFAVAFASRYPERVAKLAIASPNMGPTKSAVNAMERAVQAEREGVRSTMNESHNRSWPAHLRAADPERFRRYQSRWVCNSPASFMAQAKMMSNVDLTADYAKIRAKTLVIGALHDVMRPPSAAQKVAGLLSSSTYVEADTGHFMALQTPRLFIDTVLPFLKAA
jgi:3-oxoadipate enol-lactonase